MTMQPNKAAPPKPASRMQLGSVTSGKIDKPPRVLIFGAEGCGKTTWAANAPSPIFLCAEDGTAQLDVSRFPEPHSWTDAKDAIHELTMAEHQYKTLVIDTLDWLEPMCWDFVCKRDGMKDIEAYGFSKGQNVVALNEWRVFLAGLERMCRVKNMGVVMIGHCWVKTFKSPDSEDFDRYELSMHAKASGVLKQWCDAVLFARFETYADKDSKTKRVRGVSTGARVIHTNRTAAYDAKNRYDLPETLPMDYQAFADAVAAHTPVDGAVLKARIASMVESVEDVELKGKVAKALLSAGDNAAQLARIADNLAARISIKAQEVAQ